MQSQHWIVILMIAVAMWLSVATHKLTAYAAAAGGLVAICLYAGAGYTGIIMMGTFFIAGVVATSWKRSWKESIGAAERDKGRRKPGQVIANAGVAALAGIGAVVFPEYKTIFQLMMAAAFASAAADTMSSELGTVYGKRFYNILSFRKDIRGLDGVISIEGLLIGVIGSALIAFVYVLGFGWRMHFVWIIIAGSVGNLTDSVLGAALERKGLIKNNAVNFLNTLIAAITALLLYAIF